MMPTILQTESSFFMIDANALEDVLMMTGDNTKTSVISYMHNAKQAEKDCKQEGQYTLSRMLAAAGKMVQLANKEFNHLKNYASPDSYENHASAFARAKRN
jgi:hypothetical protein